MSRVGKEPIIIPEGVTAVINQQQVTISGPKGSGTVSLPDKIRVLIEDGKIVVVRDRDDKKVRSLHGTIRSLIANFVKGVVEEWQKELEVVGTGFQVNAKGKDLDFKLGFSHPVIFSAPEGIKFEVGDNKIKISGINKELVGNVAAKIRDIKKPDVYQGKGIRYVGEVIKLKPGKAAKVGGGE